jgi:hypothetical protein
VDNGDKKEKRKEKKQPWFYRLTGCVCGCLSKEKKGQCRVASVFLTMGLTAPEQQKWVVLRDTLLPLRYLSSPCRRKIMEKRWKSNRYTSHEIAEHTHTHSLSLVPLSTTSRLSRLNTVILLYF